MKLLIHKFHKPLAALSACVCATLIAFVPPASAAVSDTVGYNTITCLANSDTIVGVPLRQAGSVRGVVTSISEPYLHDNDTAGDTEDDFEAVDMTLTSSPSDAVNSFELTHYFQFTGNGVSKNGQYFMIMRNDGATITIDPNGATFPVGDTGGGTANSVLIAKYWTLNDLFPPAEATTAWDSEGNQNGHAIIASDGLRLSQRNTRLYMYDNSVGTINVPTSDQFYIYNNQWLSNKDNEPSGETIIWPDGYFFIRNPSDKPATEYTIVGEVSDDSHSVPIKTLVQDKKDNRLSIPRPVDVTLEQLGLFQSGAFQASSGIRLSNRRDELHVFDNSEAGINKPAKVRYYYDSTFSIWRDFSNNDATGAIIPAGSGLMIRKYSFTGDTVEWTNTPSY